jgi:pSer/pThr/pTyr-binding forkhead associated (FHA) protein
MEGRFVIRLGPRAIVLPNGRTTIGRSPDREIQIDDDRVSRRHAVLRVSDGEIDIEDLGSVNGVLVDGLRIVERTSLRDGSVIAIGDAKLVVRDRAGETPESGVVRVTPQPPLAGRAGSTSVGVSLGFSTLRTLRALEDGEIESLEATSKLLLDLLSAGGSAADDALPDALQAATRSSLALARATRDPSFIDRVFEVNGVYQRILDAETLNVVEALVADLRHEDPLACVAYVARLRDRLPPLEADEIVQLSRLEALVRAR